MKTQETENAMEVFCDILIPCNAEWPSASTALGDIAPETLGQVEEDAVWLREKSEILAQAPKASRAAMMLDLERSDPEVFGRVVSALYGAYYTSAAAHACVGRLASASPHEESPYFDPALLERVIATKAGLRRL